MKKFISGMIAGVLLVLSSSVFADTASLIGQKVQGLYTVQQGGKKIADAVIIKGTAYAPVRAVSQAAGTNLTVSGRKIIMDDEIIGPTKTIPVTLDDLKKEKDRILAEIAQKEWNIADLEGHVIPIYEQMSKELEDNGTLGKDAETTLAYNKALVEQRKAELADLKQQLNEIEAKIAAQS